MEEPQKNFAVWNDHSASLKKTGIYDKHLSLVDTNHIMGVVHLDKYWLLGHFPHRPAISITQAKVFSKFLRTQSFSDDAFKRPDVLPCLPYICQIHLSWKRFWWLFSPLLVHWTRIGASVRCTVVGTWLSNWRMWCDLQTFCYVSCHRTQSHKAEKVNEHIKCLV